MKDTILRLDAGLEEISAYSVMLGQDVEMLVATSTTSFQMLEKKLLIVACSIGDRAEDLASELAGLSHRLGGSRYVNSAPPRTDPLLAAPVGKVEADLLQTVTHLLQAIQGLNSRLDDSGPTLPVPMEITQTLESGFLTDIQARVNKMSGEIDSLRSNRQTTAIKFAGLGFDSLQKASAWLTINIPTIDAGLIVDPHTVFEHIYAETNGDNFFKNFERVHKLQILTLQQGYAMTSFQQAVPKFFSSAGTRVVRDHESFFNKISM
jgi:hypothetical protein